MIERADEMTKYKFGKASMNRYISLHDDLQKVAWKSLELGLMDFTIVCAHRSEADQNKAYNEKKSKVRWPNSKHNTYPAEAMDLAPFVNGAISWNWYHCSVLGGIVLATAKILGVELRWGGNWDMDGEPITDQDFQDLAHFELVDKR